VFLVNEKSAGSSGAGIEILVAAPDSAVDIPVMQFERNITNCVS